jgi:hypothetical protein
MLVQFHKSVLLSHLSTLSLISSLSYGNLKSKEESPQKQIDEKNQIINDVSNEYLINFFIIIWI